MKFTIEVSKAELQELEVSDGDLQQAVAEHLGKGVSAGEGVAQLYLAGYSVDVVVV